MLVGVVGGGNYVLEGFEHCGCRFGGGADYGEVTGEFVDEYYLVRVEAWGGFREELGIKAEDGAN